MLTGDNSSTLLYAVLFILPTHRLAYYWHYKVDPKELEVCHSCDVPACVNPSHLVLGTHRENMYDMTSKERFYSKLTKESVLAIRRDNRRYKDIASDYGLNQSSIGHIKNKITWTHI